METTPTFKMGGPRTLFKSRQDAVSGNVTPDLLR